MDERKSGTPSVPVPEFLAMLMGVMKTTMMLHDMGMTRKMAEITLRVAIFVLEEHRGKIEDPQDFSDRLTPIVIELIEREWKAANAE